MQFQLVVFLYLLVNYQSTITALVQQHHRSSIAVVVDSDTIRLATNPQNAYNGDVLVDFASAGTGSLTFSLFNSRGYEIQQNISTIQTINGQY